MISTVWQGLCAALGAVCVALGVTCLLYRHEAHAAQQQATALQAAVDAAHAQAVAVAATQAADSAQLREELQAAQANIKTITREVIREIPATATCPSLAGFLQHNPADADLPADPPSTGGSEPAGASVAPDAGPAARDIAATIGLAEQLRAEVITWRDWYAHLVHNGGADAAPMRDKTPQN